MRFFVIPEIVELEKPRPFGQILGEFLAVLA